jgi:hypothetical protein
VEGTGNPLMLMNNLLITIRSATPSHGRGRRFNPCSAHHSKYLFDLQKHCDYEALQIDPAPPRKSNASPNVSSDTQNDLDNGGCRNGEGA